MVTDAYSSQERYESLIYCGLHSSRCRLITAVIMPGKRFVHFQAERRR